MRPYINVAYPSLLFYPFGTVHNLTLCVHFIVSSFYHPAIFIQSFYTDVVVKGIYCLWVLRFSLCLLHSPSK